MNIIIRRHLWLIDETLRWRARIGACMSGRRHEHTATGLTRLIGHGRWSVRRTLILIIATMLHHIGGCGGGRRLLHGLSALLLLGLITKLGIVNHLIVGIEVGGRRWWTRLRRLLLML